MQAAAQYIPAFGCPSYKIVRWGDVCVRFALVWRAQAAIMAPMTKLGTRQAEKQQAADMHPNDLLHAVAQKRDRAAFIALFNYFAPRLKTYLMKQGASPQNAEELVQETMLRVWRRAKSFDPGQASASTWIFTIARNCRIDALRKQARPEPDIHDPAMVPERNSDPGEGIVAQERADMLKDALATLPPEQAAVLQMSYFEDLSQSQIAEKTGLPLGTVKSRMRLALQALRSQINGNPFTNGEQQP